MPEGTPVDPYEELAKDLLKRSQIAVRTIAELSEDTGIRFNLDDVVEAVERDLPDDYLMPPNTDPPRSEFIGQLVARILTGDLYRD